MSPTCIFINISIRHFSVLSHHASASTLHLIQHPPITPASLIMHHYIIPPCTEIPPCHEIGALDQLSHLDFVVTFFQNKFKCLSVLVLHKPLNCSLQPHIFRPTPIILFVSRNTPLVLFIKKNKENKKF